MNVLPLDTFKLISNAHNSSVCSSPRVMFTHSFFRCRYTSPPYQFRTEHTLCKQNYNEALALKQRARDDKQIPLYCCKREDNRCTITFVLDVCHVLAIIRGDIPILYFDAIFFPVNVYSKTVIRSWDNMYRGYSELQLITIENTLRFYPQIKIFSVLWRLTLVLLYIHMLKGNIWPKYNRFFKHCCFWKTFEISISG